jgi:hypothetical protein
VFCFCVCVLMSVLFTSIICACVCCTHLLVDGLLISRVHTLDGGSQLLHVGHSLENTCHVPQPSDLSLLLALSVFLFLARSHVHHSLENDTLYRYTCHVRTIRRHT